VLVFFFIKYNVIIAEEEQMAFENYIRYS